MNCLHALAVSIAPGAVNKKENKNSGKAVRSRADHPMSLEDPKFQDPTSANLISVADYRS